MTDDDLIDYELLKKLKERNVLNLIIKKEKKRLELKKQFRKWNDRNIFTKIIKDFDKELMLWLNKNEC